MIKLTTTVASLSLLFIACGPTTPDANGSIDVPDECTPTMPGPWSASGSCFGMEMTTSASVEGCAVTFSGWSMAMSVPDGAVVDGEAVTFTGVGWEDCTGTLGADGMSIDGTCSDGCDLSMQMTG